MYTMTINGHDLLALLMDEVLAMHIFDGLKSPEYKNCIYIEYYNSDGWYGEITLRHVSLQVYDIVETTDEQSFQVGETIDVDEILDIIL